MDEIDKMIVECKTERKEKMQKVIKDMGALQKDPTAEFQGAYSGSIQSLSAKEGLGKTYGQPRRLAQERLRAEMTKCEQAQKGVDELIDKLEELCERASNDEMTIHEVVNPKKGKKAPKSVSIDIRITLV